MKILLAAVMLLSPLALHAQTDPATGMPLGGAPGSSVPRPNSQGTPGVVRSNTGGMDSSQNGAAGVDAAAMRDKMFLRHVAMGSAAEVQLSQLAVQKAASEDVRKFAQHMVDDHAALANSLRPFAENLGVMGAPNPTRMDKAEYEKLNGLTGAEFDKEYLTLMAADHHRDLRTFHDEAISTADPELKEVVEQSEGVIARHTRYVDKLAAANGVVAEQHR